MIPIKITHALNEHNYLNVDASILQIIFFLSTCKHQIPMKLYIKNNIYWTVLGLSCSTRGSFWSHMDSLVVALRLSCSAAGGFPSSLIKGTCPQQGRFLSTGPLGSPQLCITLE